MVNNCLFLDNAAVTTAAGPPAAGGAIGSDFGKLTVVDSIFKKNKALSDSNVGGGGAIYALFTPDVLVLSAVFELNEASNTGGAALFGAAQFFLHQVLLGTTTRSFYSAMMPLIVMEQKYLAEIVSVLKTTFPFNFTDLEGVTWKDGFKLLDVC